jgi:hypothetical protein
MSEAAGLKQPAHNPTPAALGSGPRAEQRMIDSN